LRHETIGSVVYTIGSSAGGYAAVLFGVQLKAQRIYSFNGKFELESLLSFSKEENPLLMEYSDTPLRKYFDLNRLFTTLPGVYYFNSIYSPVDIVQSRHMADSEITMISFLTSHHGIPFLKCALGVALALDENQLKSLSLKRHLPLWFTISLSGITTTFKFSSLLLKRKIQGIVKSWG